MERVYISRRIIDAHKNICSEQKNAVPKVHLGTGHCHPDFVHHIDMLVVTIVTVFIAVPIGDFPHTRFIITHG